MEDDEFQIMPIGHMTFPVMRVKNHQPTIKIVTGQKIFAILKKNNITLS